MAVINDLSDLLSAANKKLTYVIDKAAKYLK